LCKELKPNQVVIMDNASFHKSNKVKELIESVGCKLI
jgi:transposase